MSEWRSYTEPPTEVGLYRLNDVFGTQFMVRWDGRQFRYASGIFTGRVVAHYKGDLWKSVGGEGK